MAHELFNTPNNGSLPFEFTQCRCARCITEPYNKRSAKRINNNRSRDTQSQHSKYPAIHNPSLSAPEYADHSPLSSHLSSTAAKSRTHNSPLKRPLSLHSLAATLNIDLDTHIKTQLQPQPGKIRNNSYSDMFITKRPANDPPKADNGLFTPEDIQALTIIGIYTGGEHLTSKQIRKSTYKSD